MAILYDNYRMKQHATLISAPVLHNQQTAVAVICQPIHLQITHKYFLPQTGTVITFKTGIIYYQHN